MGGPRAVGTQLLMIEPGGHCAGGEVLIAFEQVFAHTCTRTPHASHFMAVVRFVCR